MEQEHLTVELSDQDRILLVFGYMGPLAIFALIATRREFVKWHARQGLVLFMSLVALFVILRPIHSIINHYNWWYWIGELFWGCVWLVALGAALVTLLCILRGMEGERFKIPMIGDLADRI
jgi:uncharacterized membrane protein